MCAAVRTISTRWIWKTVIVVALALAAVGIKGCIDYALQLPERQARERIQTQIADVGAGRQRHVFVSNELHEAAFDEFVRNRETIEANGPFELIVEYSRDTDEFLEQIAGLKRVETLLLGKNDVTDAGMEFVATLPDLKSLSVYKVRISDAGLEHVGACRQLESLYLEPRVATDITEAGMESLAAIANLKTLSLHNVHVTDAGLAKLAGCPQLESLYLVGQDSDITETGMESLAAFPSLRALKLYDVHVTDAGLEKLRQCPHLETLYLKPRVAEEFTISAVLALPHLRELTFWDRSEDRWLEARLPQLEQATNLKKLTLVAKPLSDMPVAALRRKLPDCTIVTKNHDY